MAQTKDEGTTVRFGLSPRQAMWDPNIAGFKGLSAISSEPRTEDTVNSVENPALYEAVQRGIRAWTLVELDKESVAGKKKARKGSDTEKTSEKAPYQTANEFVQSLMSEKSQSELISWVSTCTDVNLLQIVSEFEMQGINNTGSVRRKVLDEVKKRIKVVDVPFV